MSTQLHDLLVAHRAIGTRGDAVFPSFREDASKDHISDLKHVFAEIERTTGLKLSSHDLRRTFATVCANAGVPWHAMKGLLNHALPSGDVSAGYVSNLGPALRAAAQNAADQIMRLCAVPEIAPEVARLRRR